MGRKSALSDKKWDEAVSRVRAGESVRSVAKAFGIAAMSLSRHIKCRVKPQESLALRIAEAELEFERMDVKLQVKVRNLADRLKGISEHLGAAAEFSADTTHRLTEMANNAIKEIDPNNPLVSPKTLLAVNGLTKLANEASSIPLSLLSSNRDAARAANSRPQEVDPGMTPEEAYRLLLG